MTTSEINQQVAETILQQLGGRKFTVMTGSKNYAAIENGLQMHLTRNKIGAKYLTITLDEMDTYTMTFSKLNKDFSLKVLAVKEGIYNDMLQRIFTDVTGLYTRL